MNWILIIFIFTADDKLVEKIPVDMSTKGMCERAMYNLPRRGENPAGYRIKGKCVTAKHWRGERPMKNMPLD
jgi:hypothetical protein